MTPEQLKYSILKFAFSGKLVVSDADAKLPNVKVVDFEEAPFDIPESWIWSTLGNCCEMYTGNSIPERLKKSKYTGITEGLDYIATKDVTFENSIIYDNGVRIPLSDSFRIAKTGSVLMCIEGGSAGRKIGITDRDVCFGNKLCMFNSTVIINKYIYYYLQSSEFKKSFSGNMSGIIGGVSIKKLKEIPIPVPSINEQNCIVKKIEELLPYVERYSISHEKLEQFNAKFPEDMRKAILQYAIQGKLVEQRAEEGTGEELYQQIQAEKQRLIAEKKIKKEKPLTEISEDEIPFDIPESWKWVRLGSIITFQGGYAFKSTSYVPQSNNQVIRLGNVKDNNLLIHEKEVFIDDAVAEEAHDYLIAENNILVTMTGTRRKKDYFFTVLIDKDHLSERTLYLNQRVGCFRTVGDVYPKYLLYVLQTDSIKDIIFAKETGTANQGNLGSEDMKKYVYVPLPPFSEQKRIVAKIEELLPLCEQLK